MNNVLIKVPYRLSNQSQINPGKLILYPNPAKNSITIYYPINDNEIISLFIYDQLGREVNKLDLSQASITHSISINNLMSGMYSVKLTSSLGTCLTNKLTVIK